MTKQSGGSVACYYCGSSLSAEPPGRLDECADCGKYIHVCRMCTHYDPKETSKQCREDDAEEVRDKQASNFCDYFRLAVGAFEGSAIQADTAARAELASLFGDSDSDGQGQQDPMKDESGLLQDADALFRK